jgi:CubicO group peptidase (beta-lactamase class C family)
LDRRILLKMAAAGTAATALTGVTNAASDARTVTVRSPGTSGHAYGPALDMLVAYAEQELAAAGVPGMTFCLVDAEGFAAVGTLGWADMDRRIPVGPSHLFQIGSISKSFGALCVYRLADEGKVDLDAPLSRYLPDAPLPAEPILVQQILSHTAGLPRSSPVFPRVPDQRLWTGFTPGTNFSYSNTGYELIGMLVEKISGKPYPLALRELVIRPLGITGLREVLQASDRARYAVGYSPLDASGPNMRHVALGQTQWINSDTAESNIGTTADGMTRYLKYLIAVGRGRGAPLFSDAAAKRFSTVLEPAAAAAFGKGAGYASGLAVIDFDGHAAFQHAGTICGFTSSITVDPVTGVGCFVSVNAFNAGYRADTTSTYACRLLRQVRDGGTAPSPTEATSLDHIESAEDYAGAYIAPDGDRFQLVARSGSLFLAADGNEGRMQSVGKHGFLSDHPRFGSHFFDFDRSGDAVIAVWFGPVLYGRGVAVPQPAVPPELAALQGIYVSSDPWSGWWRSVVAQGERLVIENIAIYHVKNTLHRKGDYWHPESADNPCERVRFDAVMNGVPQRLNVSGRDLWRFNRI